MRHFYEQLAEVLQQETVVLATITAVQGSVPREVGAKMIVCADGRLIGTIGGGAGEAVVQQRALTVLQSGTKQFVEIDLSGAPDRETQGICGGKMQVWLERWAGAEAQALVAQILNSLSLGGAAIVTPFDSAKSPYLMPSDIHTIEAADHALIEPLVPPPTLIIVGAGHVAIPLAQIAQLAGFEIVVLDDRPDFANPARFPKGATVMSKSVEQAIIELPPIPNLYAALVTRGYLHDVEPLKALLQRPTRYIGMIGSQKRVRRVRQALVQAGYSTEAVHLYAPIGLDIGALTPEEIAVSICAELILVRRGGIGRSLSQRSQNHQ